MDKIDQNMVMLFYQEAFNEYTFFKSLIMIHFHQLILQESLDIYNLSLFDMYEWVNQKKIVLYSIPLKDIQEQTMLESYRKVMYDLAQMKNTSTKEALFEKFLYYFTNDTVFCEALIQIMKQVIIQCCNQKDYSNEISSFQHMILQNWFEIKPEFLPMLSNALNKVIEINYLLDNKIETTVYNNVKNRFSQSSSKVIKIIYNYNLIQKKQYYMPLLTQEEAQAFGYQSNLQPSISTVSVTAYLEQNKPTSISNYNTLDLPGAIISTGTFNSPSQYDLTALQREDQQGGDDSPKQIQSKSKALTKLKSQINQNYALESMKLQHRPSADQVASTLYQKMKISPKKQHQQFRSSADLCYLQGTGSTKQAGTNNLYNGSDIFNSQSIQGQSSNTDNSKNIYNLNLPKYDYELLNKIDLKLNSVHSSEGSLQNKLIHASPADRSPMSTDSNVNGSENYNFLKDEIIEPVENNQTKRQQQYSFNSKKLSEKIQDFMVLCKDNTTKIQDLFGYKKFLSQQSLPSSSNNTQYQPSTSNQSSQPQSQQKLNENKATSGTTQIPPPIPRSHFHQASTNTPTSIQRTQSPIHTHPYSLNSQHTVSTPNTGTAQQRVVSPTNNQRFGNLQSNTSRPSQLSKFSDVVNSFGYSSPQQQQSQNTNASSNQSSSISQQQQQQQQQQQLQPTIQQSYNGNQQVLIYPQQQQQQVFIPNSQIYSNNPTTIINHNMRFNNYTSGTTASIQQNKFHTQNINTPMSYLGSPSTKQANVDFQQATQTYYPQILGQKQLLLGKKF